MKPLLRIGWLTGSADGQEAALADVDEYARAIDAASRGTSRRYRWVSDSAIAKAQAAQSHRPSDEGPLREPSVFVMTPLESIEASIAVETAVEKALDSLPGLWEVQRALYHEIDRGPGGAATDAPLADELHFGTYDMVAPEDEWDIIRWYDERRYPTLASLDGVSRVRRFVSVAGGPAKFGVLYEFSSRQERLDHYAPAERDTTYVAPSGRTVIQRTVHPSLSPTIGSAIVS